MLTEIRIERAGKSGAIWNHPFQVVSLLEVLRFRADLYFATATSLAGLKAISMQSSPGQKQPRGDCLQLLLRNSSPE